MSKILDSLLLKDTKTGEATEYQIQDSQLKARVDNLIANAGNTDDNAELIDIRVGEDGTQYPTAGEAVRGQVSKLKDDLVDVRDVLDIQKSVTDLLGYADINTKAYIKSDGTLEPSSSWQLYIIPISSIGEFDKIRFKTYSNTTIRVQYAIYSSDSTFDSSTMLEFAKFNTGNEANMVELTSLPNNASCIIIANMPSVGTDIEIIKEYGITCKTDGLDEVYDNLDFKYQITDLLNFADFGKYYVNGRNEINTSTAWNSYSVPIAYFDGCGTIKFKSAGGLISYAQIAFLDENVNVLSAIRFNKAGEINENSFEVNEIPFGTKVVMLCGNINTSTDFVFEAYSSQRKSKIDLLNEKSVTVDKELMEISRSRFDTSFNYVAYSAVRASTGSPNTLEHYQWCAKRPYTGIKGDVRLSSDNKIIMCHDAGFTLDENGDVIEYDINNNTKIRDMTEEQCKALKHAGTNDSICGLEELVRTCKMHGKIAYITLRDADINIIIQEVFRILDIYQMRKRTIINSFTYDTIRKVRLLDDDIYLSWVATYNHIFTNEDVDKANALGNCMLCGYDYSGATPTKAINQQDNVLAYAREKGIRIYEAQITTDEDLLSPDLIDRGFTGGQIAFLPEMFTN